MNNETIINHDGVNFRVESFEIEGAFQTKIKHQAFTMEGYALSEIEENRSIAIMQAIKTINENRDRF